MKAERFAELAGVLTEGHVLGKSDEFRLEIQRGTGMVDLIDGEGTIRVSMPKDVWLDLAEKTAKSLGTSMRKAY